MTEPTILVVEDDVETRQLYQEILEDAGYQVTLAGSRQVALDALASGKDWWVVLIDRMLQGELGGDEGTGLLTAVRDQAPAAVAIVVTAYIDPDAIKRAFELGVWDYIQKSPNFHHVLLAKVRNAVEAQRDRRLVGRDPNRVVQEAWAAAHDETVTAQVRGQRLEALVVALFRSVPGFAHARTNWRNDSQEFDVLVRNESKDPLWERQGDYLLVECKRWKVAVDPSALYSLQAKASQRYGRCKLAFLVAWSGFTGGVVKRLLPGAKEDLLIVLLDRADLAAWVNSADRNTTLKGFLDRAAIEDNG